MKWEDKYSVNIRDIDAQHKKLFDLVNELFDAMRTGKGREALGGVLDELIRYTDYHFSAEERLLESISYPGFGNHKTAHELLTRKAKKLKQAFDEGNRMISMDLMNFLRDWLNVHILEEDKKYSYAVAGRGIK